MTPGEVLRKARLGREVSQEELAIRAGTTQSAVSRIERDRVSPSVETLRGLLFVLGEDLVLDSEPRDFGVDRTLNQANLALSPSQRVKRGLAFADVVRRNKGASLRRRGLERQ
ncbi:MAG TPA: helix-turn-helix transcriptional regulator [Solirubrobacterales bacterium]|nr:helix-turn-helix transcriptional regulator [Solirubrobacterales bacterium]